jgi:hypothetical protein
MTITCPDCQAPLEPLNGVAHCESCNKDIALEARCPECHQPLQVLKPAGRWTISARTATVLSQKTRGVCSGRRLIAHAAFAFLPQLDQRLGRFLLRHQHDDIGVVRLILPGPDNLDAEIALVAAAG